MAPQNKRNTRAHPTPLAPNQTERRYGFIGRCCAGITISLRASHQAFGWRVELSVLHSARVSNAYDARGLQRGNEPMHIGGQKTPPSCISATDGSSMTTLAKSHGAVTTKGLRLLLKSSFSSFTEKGTRAVLAWRLRHAHASLCSVRPPCHRSLQARSPVDGRFAAQPVIGAPLRHRPLNHCSPASQDALSWQREQIHDSSR